MDFAPVADVRTNPANTVIGDRSYSRDPAVVCAMTDAVAQGLLSRGIIPVYKHFPGHGDAAGDSHLGLAVLRLGFEYLASLELTQLGTPLLNRLCDELRTPCNLVVRDGRSIAEAALGSRIGLDIG